jgi:REP-associated tyrosine transposase
MSRPLRIEFTGAVYHVINRGTARQTTFLDEHDDQAFLNTLAEAHRQWGIEVFSYCLMRNHYHVCLRTPKGNLSRVMRHIDGLYTQRFNRHHKRDGALFRGRYKAILVDEDEYLAQVVRYIHLNPVGAGVVKQPEDYRWSSHFHYLQPKGAPEWLNTEEVLEQVGGKQAFHEFVLSGNEEALERYYASKRQSPVLGRDEFIEKVKGKDVKLNREVPRYHRRAVRADPDQVIEKVAGMYGIARDEVLSGVRGKENEARKVAMYLVTRCCDRTLGETASLFGLGSYGAVGWACHGVKAKMERETKFRDQLERIAGEIYQQKI